MANLDVAVTLRLVNQLSGPAKAAADDLKRVATTANGLAGAKGGEQIARDLQRASAAGGRLTADMRMAGTATATFGRELDRVAAASGRATTTVARLPADLRAADGAAKALAADLDRAAAAAGRASRSAAAIRGGTGRGPERPAREAASTGRDGTVMALGRNAFAAAGGLYVAREAVRRTVGEAISFEKAWSEVVKKVNDAPNPKAMDDLQTSIRRTAIELGVGRERMAALTAEAGASGIAFRDLERFTRLAAKGAVGWDMAPEEASGKLANIKSGTGMTLGELEVLGDKINALGDNSAARERDIVEMFNRAGAAAKAAGVDFDTSLAFLTGIRSTGMQEDVAARFWTSFTGKLATAGAGGRGAKDLAAGLKILGLTTKQVADGMRRDAGGTILDLFDRLTKAGEPAKAALKVVGGEWWDEAMRAAAAAAEIRKARGILADPGQYRGSLAGNMNVTLATTAKHLEQLSGLAKEVGDRMGAWALPGINESVQKLIGLYDDLNARFRVHEAGQTDADKADPMARAAQALGAGTANRVLRGAIDSYFPKPTDDPRRAFAEQMRQESGDAGELARKRLAEAKALRERAKLVKGSARAELTGQAEVAQADAVKLWMRSQGRQRYVGPALAADMTDVEIGEAAARRSIEERRRLNARAAELDGALGSSTGKVVQDPAKGTYAAREVLEAEVEAVREKIRQIGSEAAKDVKPSTGVTPNKVDDVAKELVRLSAMSGNVKAVLAQDLSGPAEQSMAGYNAALQAGSDRAVRIGEETAAKLRSVYSFTATPTIAPRLTAPSASSGGITPVSLPRSGGSGGGGGVSIQNAHFHGVGDMDGLHREASRLADNAAKDSRWDALHDLGTAYT